jgi:hypothetical protein
VAADSPLIEDAADPAQALHLLRKEQGPRSCKCSSGRVSTQAKVTEGLGPVLHRERALPSLRLAGPERRLENGHPRQRICRGRLRAVAGTLCTEFSTKTVDRLNILLVSSCGRAQAGRCEGARQEGRREERLGMVGCPNDVRLFDWN